jgi:hypothetical protein
LIANTPRISDFERWEKTTQAGLVVCLAPLAWRNLRESVVAAGSLFREDDVNHIEDHRLSTLNLRRSKAPQSSCGYHSIVLILRRCFT